MSNRVFVIAEAGVNHNGDLSLAKQLIDVAASAGADAVKFQTFRAAHVISRGAPKAAYQNRTTDQAKSQFEMLQSLELDAATHETLVSHAKRAGIEFLSTPFDAISVRLLSDRFGVTTLKIPSGEITNAPLLLDIARAAKRVILSTGMSTLGDVERALGVLAFGFLSPPGAMPRPGDFERAFAGRKAREALRARVTLLHCTTEYPAPCADVNLRAMTTMAAAFGLAVGYSDHTPGIHVALAAVALGACVIEKHFTLDRDLPGPDHRASLEPQELISLVEQVRDVEAALGDGMKRPAPSEWCNRDVIRRSLVAAVAIRKGECFTAANITCKRPGTGISPEGYWDILGHPATRDYEADELLDG